MSKHGCWSRKSIFEKILIVICLLLFITAICLAIVTVITDDNLRRSEVEASLICNTPECIEAASEILRSIDPSVKPCENFYEFACGNFKKKNVIPSEYTILSTISKMQEDIYINLKRLIEPPVSHDDTEVTVKTKNLYASCMNSSVEDGSVENLKKLLERVGGWPIADDDWNKRDLNLERRLAILLVHGITPFIKTAVWKENKNYILYLASGSLILSYRFYLNETNEDYVKYINSYEKMLIGAARLLGADEETIQKDVEELLKFEKEYAKISEENTIEKQGWNSNETDTDDERYTISELEMYMPKIKWGTIFDYVFDYLKLSVRKDGITVKLENQYYIRSLTFLVRKTTPRTMANYLTWRLIFKLMPYLDIHFRRLYYDFMKEVPSSPPKAQEVHLSRWKECMEIVNEIFPLPLTLLYAKENFDTERENEMLALISSLKQGTIDGIHKQDWLDVSTKKMCEEKVEKMQFEIAFPSYILKPGELEKEYSGLKVSRDRFLDNLLKINRLNVESKMSVLIGKKKRETEWLKNPLKVNAYFKAPLNLMIFPLAMMRSPIYEPRRPKFLNYGRMGMIIGHEIGHGFDTKGRRYMPDKEHNQQWKDEFVEKYIDLASCFVDQYSKLPISMLGINVNGNKTVNDNIADNSGLRNAYRAYNTYVSKHGEEPKLPGLPYTNLQLFFISYGQVWCELRTKKGYEAYIDDEHSPSRHRINVPMMNSPEFSTVFNCPLGSPMNPVKKCNLWG